jgi:O-antigen ligase
LTFWLGFGGGSDTMEGSPLDRAFYFVMIFLALVILLKRRLDWSNLVSRNWPIFLFYGFLLISVLWAESPFVSFKRWFKDLGNIFVAGVILTEEKPQEAIRVVFVRCAYLFFPLSIVFIRYFPSLGRFYGSHGGEGQICGVTTQKNSLGVLVLICGLILLWDWFEHSPLKRFYGGKLERYLVELMLPMGIYLLYLCNSKTSLICLLVGAGLLSAIRLPVLRKRVGALGIYTLAVVAGYYLVDSMFGVRDELLGSIGRDASLTGRTEVWRELLALKTDPIIGTGFCSIWSDQSYLSRMPDWIGHSAHSGYLETYLDGGMIGISFLLLMLLGIAIKLNAYLTVGGNYAVVRFAVLVVTLIGNYSESHFVRMSPLWFLFLLTALDVRQYRVAIRRPLVALDPNPNLHPQPVLLRAFP